MSIISCWGMSEKNRQKNPIKPNEDGFGSSSSDDSSAFCAVVMDGIPVPRNEDGTYPFNNGKIAADLAVNIIITASLRNNPSSSGMIEAFRTANLAIGKENERLGLHEKDHRCRLGAVGCAVSFNKEKGTAIIGYIGDPFMFMISTRGEARILTDDQLQPWQSHYLRKHWKETEAETHTSIRGYQDEHVRNVLKAKCFCGESVRGWGALTGDPGAMDFVAVTEFPIEWGSRFILASDAIEVFGKGKGVERNSAHYEEVFSGVSTLDPLEASGMLIKEIRLREYETGKKSDDATVVVVDFGTTTIRFSEDPIGEFSWNFTGTPMENLLRKLEVSNKLKAFIIDDLGADISRFLDLQSAGFQSTEGSIFIRNALRGLMLGIEDALALVRINEAKEN